MRGNGNDGVASTDGLVITSGTLTVTAKDDGIRGTSPKGDGSS